MDTDVMMLVKLWLALWYGIQATHAPRLSAVKSCILPEGLDIDRLVCSIIQTVKEYFIRVYRRSSAFILWKEAFKQMKKTFATRMHTDGHRCNDKNRYRLNCFLHCDRASMKETLSPYGQQRVAYCPQGWILTGWYVLSNRRSKNTSSGFIGVHQRSSC